jgi:integrase
VHVTSATVGALRKLKKTKTPASSPVFPFKWYVLENRWSKIRDAAGVKDFRWHDLRHSCASFLARGGSTLLQISDVLGHKSLASTKRYSHLAEGKAVPGHAALDKLLRGK